MVSIKFCDFLLGETYQQSMYYYRGFLRTQLTTETIKFFHKKFHHKSVTEPGPKYDLDALYKEKNLLK